MIPHQWPSDQFDGDNFSSRNRGSRFDPRQVPHRPEDTYNQEGNMTLEGTQNNNNQGSQTIPRYTPGQYPYSPGLVPQRPGRDPFGYQQGIGDQFPAGSAPPVSSEYSNAPQLINRPDNTSLQPYYHNPEFTMPDPPWDILAENQPQYGNTIISERHIAETLDPEFRIHLAGFFVLGRVFKLLWHENAGSNGTVLSQFIWRGPYGQEVYSNIRRMVVFKRRQGCCWCVPISTYGRQGVAKSGVDPSSHAIIYMSGTAPRTRPDEPRMDKEPIAVIPANPSEKLDKMSRVNFSKIYTVEHNIKVKNVGRVAQESLQRLLQYCNIEMSAE